MDKTLLILKITEWRKACDYFSQDAVLRMLATEEREAIKFLIDFWQMQRFNRDACEARIEILKQCDKLHSADREIIVRSKVIRGIAQMFYTKDAATYAEFCSAMRQATEPRPTPKPTPQRQPTPPPPPPPPRKRESALIIGNVVFASSRKDGTTEGRFCKILYNTVSYIKPKLIVTSEYYGRRRIDVELKYSDGKSDCYSDTVEFKGQGEYTISGWGNEKGMPYAGYTYIDYTLRTDGKMLWSGRLNIERDPNAAKMPTISNMVFGAVDGNGNIVVDFGRPLFTGIPYIKPRITVSNNFVGTAKFDVKFEYSNKPSDSYTCEVKIKGAGDYLLSGWGNSECKSYREPQNIRVRVSYNSTELYSAVTKVLSPIDVVFANSRKDGSVVSSYGKRLYNTVQYIKPKLLVQQNLRGKRDITVELRYSDGKSGSYNCAVNFAGPGEYTLSGWGHESGTSYAHYTYIDYTLRADGNVLWSGRLEIARDPSLPTRPTISKMIFGAVDYHNNIVVDYGRPLPTGIPYIQPRITVSNNFVGTAKFDITFDYSTRKTESYTCEIKITGAGDYLLSGWGNSECKTYREPQRIKVTVAYNGTELCSEIVRVG